MHNNSPQFTAIHGNEWAGCGHASAANVDAASAGGGIARPVFCRRLPKDGRQGEANNIALVFI
jgi:hypothetical protein